jgi:hypothetical protein
VSSTADGVETAGAEMAMAMAATRRRGGGGGGGGGDGGSSRASLPVP